VRHIARFIANRNDCLGMCAKIHIPYFVATNHDQGLDDANSSGPRLIESRNQRSFLCGMSWVGKRLSNSIN